MIDNQLTQDELDAALNTVVCRDDCARIVIVVAHRLGLVLDLRGAAAVWSHYSECRFSASWLGISGDDEILNAVQCFVMDQQEFAKRSES